MRTWLLASFSAHLFLGGPLFGQSIVATSGEVPASEAAQAGPREPGASGVPATPERRILLYVDSADSHLVEALEPQLVDLGVSLSVSTIGRASPRERTRDVVARRKERGFLGGLWFERQDRGGILIYLVDPMRRKVLTRRLPASSGLAETEEAALAIRAMIQLVLDGDWTDAKDLVLPEEPAPKVPSSELAPPDHEKHHSALALMARSEWFFSEIPSFGLSLDYRHLVNDSWALTAQLHGFPEREASGTLFSVFSTQLGGALGATYLSLHRNHSLSLGVRLEGAWSFRHHTELPEGWTAATTTGSGTWTLRPNLGLEIPISQRISWLLEGSLGVTLLRTSYRVAGDEAAPLSMSTLRPAIASGMQVNF